MAVGHSKPYWTPLWYHADPVLELVLHECEFRLAATANCSPGRVNDYPSRVEPLLPAILSYDPHLQASL